MLTTLAAILLVIGLIQSILDLRKEETSLQNPVKKVLQIFYIIGFFVGLFVLVLQSNASDDAEKNLNKMSNNVQDISGHVVKIDTSLEEKMSTTFRKSDSLRKIADILNSKISSLIKSSDAVMSQYAIVNSKLSNQVDIEQKQLLERKPRLQITNNDIQWIHLLNDSTFWGIKACLKNSGNRGLSVLNFTGHCIFYGKDDKPFTYLDLNTVSESLYIGSSQMFCLGSFELRLDSITLNRIGKCLFVTHTISFDEVLNIKDTTNSYFSFDIHGDKTASMAKGWESDWIKQWESLSIKPNNNSFIK